MFKNLSIKKDEQRRLPKKSLGKENNYLLVITLVSVRHNKFKRTEKKIEPTSDLLTATNYQCVGSEQKDV